MNIRDFLVPVLLACTTVWVWRTWISPEKPRSSNTSGAVFTAPESAVQARLINTAIMCDEQDVSTDDFISIETGSGIYKVSSRTGSIQQFFARVQRGYEMREYEQRSVEGCSVGSLDVVLEDNTIAQFDSHTIDVTEKETVVMFENRQLGLQKKLIFAQDTHRVDIELSANALFSSQILRILLPSSHDVFSQYSGVANKDSSLQAIAKKDVKERSVWLQPHLFGVATKYFVHALYADKNDFVQRAFYADQDDGGLIAFIEGMLEPAQEVRLSCYFGPRDLASLVAVDASLADLEGYSGIFAPLARYMTLILRYIADLTGNIGWGVIVLAIILRILLLPFNIVSPDAIKRQAEMKRRVAYVQQKYKDDPERMARERLQIMSSHGGLGGKMFLGVFLELPIIFTIRMLLTSSFAFYDVPFLWLADLGAPDPFYILPVLFFAIAVLQAFAGSSDERIMKLVFALIGVSLFVQFSSGFLLYLMLTMGLRTLLPPLVQRVQRAAFA